MDTTRLDGLLETLERLIAVDSPTGYTRRAQTFVADALGDMGFEPETPNKGGVLCCLGGEGAPLLLAAHIDTLGACVQTIKGSGALKVSPIGGLDASNVETETVRVVPREGACVEGTFQLVNASVHVNDDGRQARTFGNVEVVLDAPVRSAQDARALGIRNGDIVCVNPRFTVTATGYVKSRFLDDKASAAVLLTLASAVRAGEVSLSRKVYLLFTVHEEIGHGGAANIPPDVLDMVSVDMGCVGDGLECRETQVSICCKDSGGPYDYELTGELIAAAKRAGADYALDVYPHYGSDVESTFRAGWNVRGALIGPGVYASHGYERTHKSSLAATYDTLAAFVSGAR